MNIALWGGGMLWLAVFGGYLWTLCPTVYVGDAGELIAAAYTLGSPHPPGYPVFCLLNKGISVLLPLGSVAYRVNLGSAILSATTIALVYFSLLQWSRGTTGVSGIKVVMAAAVAATLGFSESFWTQATEAEVYALNSWFTMGWLALLAWWLSDPSRETRLYVCAVWLGVGTAVHQLTLLILPLFLVVWMIQGRGSARSWRVLMTVGGCFALGCLANLYLPLRAAAEPPINWGHPDSWDRFLDHVRRRQYGRLAKHERSLSLLMAQVGFLIESFFRQIRWWWLPMMGWGWWRMIHRWPGLGWSTTWLFSATSIGLAVLFNFPSTAASYMAVSVFFVPTYLMAILWVGVGVLSLGDRPRWVGGLAMAVVVAGPAYGWSRHFREADHHNHTVSHDYGVALLASLPERSTLIASGDNAMFSLAYLQLVERRRTDLTVYDDSGYIFPNIYGLDFLRRDAVGQETHRLRVQRGLIAGGSGPVYYTLENTKHDMTGIRLSPSGLVQEAEMEGENPKGRSSRPSPDLWRRYFIRSAHEERMYEGDYITRNLMAQFFYQMGGFLHERGRKDAARRLYRQSDRIGYDNEWIQSNLGVILMNRGEHVEAVERCRRAVDINPQSGEAYLNLGAALDAYAESLRGVDSEKSGRLEREARLAYERAIQLKPTYTTAYFNLGNTYMGQGRFQEAIEQYQKALTHNPRSVEAHINLGNALDGWADRLTDPVEKEKTKSAAMEAYRRALSLRPDSVEAHINLGTAYFNRGQRGAAKQEYEAALQFDPLSVEAHFNLANVDLTEGMLAEAFQRYQRVIGINPVYVEAYFAAGIALEKLGRKGEATEWWRRGLRIDPHHLKIQAKLRQG